MNTLIKYTVAIIFCITGSLLWVDNASGAKPTKVIVESTTPDNAFQGSSPENGVRIKGSGFGHGSTVRFLVSGSNDDTQVEITGLAQFEEESGDLVVPIHVLDTATVDFYDVEVRTSSGRRGKGTDLFSVKQAGQIEYTVELTGVFKFGKIDAGPVSLNSKGHLKSVDALPLMIARPLAPFGAVEPTEEQRIWDAVINNCGGPLVGNPTIEFMLVDFDEWGVGRNGDAGNLWINFSNIRLSGNDIPEKKIQIQLQRRFAENPTFLPDPGGSITHELDWFVVWGKPFSGKKRSWDTCYQFGDGNDDGVNLLPANLTITRPLLP